MSNYFNTEDIHLHKVNTFKSIIDIDYDINKLIAEYGGLRFCFGQKTSVNPEDKAVKIRLSIVGKGVDKYGKEMNLTINYGIEFHYRIDNFELYSTTDSNGNKKFKEEFGAAIIGIAFSTARGIIYTQTEGSVLNGVLLPVIAPKLLFQEEYTYDVKFD